jgi:hypothetical protein
MNFLHSDMITEVAASLYPPDFMVFCMEIIPNRIPETCSSPLTTQMINLFLSALTFDAYVTYFDVWKQMDTDVQDLHRSLSASAHAHAHITKTQRRPILNMCPMPQYATIMDHYLDTTFLNICHAWDIAIDWHCFHESFALCISDCQ